MKIRFGLGGLRKHFDRRALRTKANGMASRVAAQTKQKRLKIQAGTRMRSRSGRGGRSFKSCHSDQYLGLHGVPFAIGCRRRQLQISHVAMEADNGCSKGGFRRRIFFVGRYAPISLRIDPGLYAVREYL